MNPSVCSLKILHISFATLTPSRAHRKRSWKSQPRSVDRCVARSTFRWTASSFAERLTSSPNHFWLSYSLQLLTVLRSFFVVRIFFAAPVFALVDLEAVPEFTLDFAAPALALVNIAADLRVDVFFATELVCLVVLVAVLGSLGSLVGTHKFRGWKAVLIPFAANAQSYSTSAQKPARRAEVSVAFENSLNCRFFGCNRFLSAVSL